MRPLVRGLLVGSRCPQALQWAQTQLASWAGRKSGKGEAAGSAHLQHSPHWRWGLKASNLPSCCWPDSTDGACPHDPLQLGSRSSCSVESRRCQPCHTPAPLLPGWQAVTDSSGDRSRSARARKQDNRWDWEAFQWKHHSHLKISLIFETSAIV